MCCLFRITYYGCCNVFALIQYYGKDKTIVGEESIKENGQAALMEEEDFSNGI